MLMGAGTNKTPKQSRIIDSFSVIYLAALAGPKTGRRKYYNFGALKIFKDWDHRVTLTKSMRIEISSLKGNFNARLCRHPEAKDLCLKILQAAMDFWG